LASVAPHSLAVPGAKSFAKRHGLSQVEAVHAADGQVDAFEPLLAKVVGLVLTPRPVVLAVELRSQAGFGVEQVGYAEEATIEIKHRPVDQRPRQPGLLLLEHPQP
jgi:hypothetical protein